MVEDYFTHTEADAGAFARAYAEPDDDRPSLSDLAAEERDDLEEQRRPRPRPLDDYDPWSEVTS